MKFLVSVLAVLALVGCSRTTSSTTVDVNGDWHRTVKLTMTKGMGPGDIAAEGDPWPNLFKLPTGAEWKKTEAVKDDEKTIVLTRDCQAGETLLTDIVIRDEKSGVTTLKNFVRVREIEPGVFEYYEKIVNPNPEDGEKQSELAKFAANFRSVLPEGLNVDDATIKTISKQMVVSISRIMFGPDDHLFGTLVTNPEGAVRRLKLSLGKSLEASLVQHMGGKMSAEQRREVVLKLMKEIDAEQFKDAKKSEASPDKAGNGSFTGMSVSVKLPGEITSTNGEIDPYTGEVFWDFLSASAEIEPLELRAICRVKR